MKLPDTLQAGRGHPMGSTLRDGGVNFAVMAEHASKVELCLFDQDGQRELRRYALHGPEDGVWHGFLPGLGAGLVYGLRAHGPYQPEQGHRYNANKLLLDPMAREIVGHFGWRAEHHGYTLGHPEGPRGVDGFDPRDNAPYALKSRVAAPLTGPDPRSNAPHHPVDRLLIYEAHVKGLTMQHPAVPPELRGRYAALAHPAVVAHLKQLGVNAIELLPLQFWIDEVHLADKGMRNYWGYNTLGFCCPDPRLAQAQDPAAIRAEFRAAVHALHEAGIEVLLDVVFNHTPEGNEFGPTLSFRGLDNAIWYRLQHDDRSRHENLTGCGNTLNCAHPRVTQFVLDALRVWVAEMGVDGFRFDLAPVLGRGERGFGAHAALFTAMRQDPLLASVKLIAEPWDAAYDGYQLGHFPGPFLEWNDRFRDAARSYWLGTGVSRGEFARRLTASSDVFHHGQRLPTASVNFIACHDGFTLADLTSYGKKHNHGNGEDNRDGRDNELCANFGHEGPTDDAAVNERRRRVRRALLATLAFAQGTPMLNAGDEFANSQQGNNNAYCQDNPTGWLDWAAADADLLAFTARCFQLRAQEVLLRHPRWLVAETRHTRDAQVEWLTPAGHGLQSADWHSSAQRAFAAVLQGDGRRLGLLFNPEAEAMPFTLVQGPWRLMLDSSGVLHETNPMRPDGELLPGQPLIVPAHSLVLLATLETCTWI
ncbi:MAG: glycogen debranching protein GlgX [Burkholderiales bacterium]|nr:glycogen debranching protein GlgX [Burkholderiales bacterium]